MENYGFYKCLKDKQEAIYFFKNFFWIVTIGLVVVSLFIGYQNLYPHIIAALLVTILLEIMELKIEKYWRNPEKLTVYDSYVVYKIEGGRTEYYDDSRSHSTPYKIYIKKDTWGSFGVTVGKEIWKCYQKNDRILAIKAPLIGGILVTEEDCRKFNFQKIIVRNSNEGE